MHIQGLRRQLSWVACAAVLIWFWNWVLVWFFFCIFCWYFLFGSCCVFIFLEAHYLTAARWTKNENWPKSRHINHQSSRTHTNTHTYTLLFGVESLTARRKISLFPNGSQMATATSRYFIKPHKSKTKGILHREYKNIKKESMKKINIYKAAFWCGNLTHEFGCLILLKLWSGLFCSAFLNAFCEIRWGDALRCAAMRCCCCRD